MADNGKNGNADSAVKLSKAALSVRQTFILAVISAVLGGAGGPYLLSRIFPDAIRPDPYTGTQGKLLEGRVARIEKEHERHVDSHPDQEGKFENRLATLEAQIAILIVETRRNNDKLDALARK